MTIDSLVVQIAELTGVTKAEILSKSRERRQVAVRHAAMWLAMKRGATSVAVGRYFNRDHTTVLYAYRKVEEVYFNRHHESEDVQGSLDSVARVCRRLKLFAPPPSEPPVAPYRAMSFDRERLPWTLTEDAVAQALFGLGCTYRQIGNWLSRTRDAVHAHAHLVHNGLWKPYTHVGGSDDEAWVRLWQEEGLTQHEIAAKLRISASQLRIYLKAIGLQRKQLPFAEGARITNLILDMRHRRGLTQRQIACALNCGVGVVSGRLHRARKLEMANAQARV